MSFEFENTSQPPFERRLYQFELIEGIKKRNAILFLPTGSGKTYIALEIIGHVQKDQQKPGKKTIFLANTVALVEQHESFLKRHSSFNIMMLTGDVRIDQWKPCNWSDREKNAQIIVMTSQIYVNLLMHGYMRLKDANLIIFDECHHAVLNHPMREVMKFFDTCHENDHPKILGLTATLINANTSLAQFHEHLTILENTFKSKIITSSRVAEVKKFSTKAKERHEKFTPYESPRRITTQITELINKHNHVLEQMELKNTKACKSTNKLINNLSESRVKLLKNCVSDVKVHLEEFGMYFCYVSCIRYITRLKRIMHEKTNEEAYCNALLMLITLLRTIRKLLADYITRFGDINRICVITKHCAEKLDHLLKQLKQFSPTDKCIIFVERRMSANILSEIIEIFLKENNSQMMVDFIVGSSPHPLRNFKEDSVDKKRNKQVMEKFRSGKINILVASNVLEEGIDMPDCNVVYMYDFPKTFRSYIQSRGRARDKHSSYVLFIDKDHDKCFDNIEYFKELETKLEEMVPLFDISSDCDNRKDFKRKNYEDNYTTRNGATITKTQAIPIIERYCSTLPRDNFTELTPHYWKCNVENGLFCKLKFPMNAAIKEIEGPVCRNIKDAKQAVAFKAVKILHQKKALNDSLMPIVDVSRMDDLEYWFPYWRDISNADGDTEFLRKEVKIKIPKYLENCRPVANQICYLHVINISCKYSKPTTHPRKICDRLLSSPYELGIITRHQLPKVCNFPVFSDLGEVEISIDTNYCSWKVSEDELSAASKFHRTLLLKALQVVNKCLIYSDDPDESMGYFIVPLRPNGNSAWNLEIVPTDKLNGMEIPIVEKPSAEELQKRVFTEQNFENYWGYVVLPWYLQHRNGEGTNYHVITDVDQEKNMSYPFPNKNYSSYADYYDKVHNLRSSLPHQPLLEARPMPLNNLNCLRPRANSEQESKKNKAKKQSIYLVPEFCAKILFPSCYWYKATILPTVLHRLHFLLLAEEIREKIVLEGGIGAQDWDKGPNDILPIHDKYDFRKTESSCKPVNCFSSFPSLITLQNHANYQGPKQKEIFEALTPKRCNDILDLERLETLGDSFLKFAVSFAVFVMYNSANEGFLTKLKGRLVGNHNLMCCGNRLNLESYIKMYTFSIQNWTPPGFVMPDFFKALQKINLPVPVPHSIIFHLNIPLDEQFSGVISQNTILDVKKDVNKFLSMPDESKEKDAMVHYGKQSPINDKTIADVIEALIGVYVKTGGVKVAYQLSNYFGILVPKYDDIMAIRVPSPLLKKKFRIEEFVPNWKKLEKLLRYEFRDKAYILQALSHPSYLNNMSTNCYQTLEFVGDAVLDFLITSFIYEYCGDLPPGKVTDLRASLVNNITFGALCVRVGFHEYLLSDNQKLTDAINYFTNYQRTRNHEIHGNEMLVKVSKNVAEEVEVPKVLGDLFESLAGAIFLDSGNDLNEVWRVYYCIMEKEIRKFSEKIPINPVRALYEIPNLKTKFVNEITDPVEKKAVKLSITLNNKQYEYIGKGENYDNAKRAVAKLALRELSGRTEFFI